MFGTLRLGNNVYILDRSDKLTLKIGLVVSTTSLPNYGYMGNIDITVKSEDLSLEFKQLPSLMCTANYNNTTISDSPEQMTVEVESLMSNSRKVIDSIPYHESILTEGEEIIKLLNPLLAKQKDLELKINNLETKVGSMESKLDDIATMLTKVLNK